MKTAITQTFVAAGRIFHLEASTVLDGTHYGAHVHEDGRDHEPPYWNGNLYELWEDRDPLDVLASYALTVRGIVTRQAEDEAAEDEQARLDQELDDELDRAFAEDRERMAAAGGWFGHDARDDAPW